MGSRPVGTKETVSRSRPPVSLLAHSPTLFHSARPLVAHRLDAADDLHVVPGGIVDKVSSLSVAARAKPRDHDHVATTASSVRSGTRRVSLTRD